MNERECHDFSHLIQNLVSVDGSLYRVKGVERLMHHPPWRKGEKIVLHVE